jgi:ketosteroid isomerase-like protein
MLKSVVAVCAALVVFALAVSTVSTQGTTAADVAAITKIVNDIPKADLANDASFYANGLADDWTGGNSRGTWDTKASILADMKDTKNNKTTSETVSNIKVRTHGDVAIATYNETYDALIQGQKYARTVICTETYHRMGGAWKSIASHCSTAAAK